MPVNNAEAWDRHAAGYQAGARLPTDVAHYGPDIPNEDHLRLIGDLRDKRVLELGCGGAQCSIAFAKAGAHAFGIDFSSEQLAFARRLAAKEKVKLELHHGDLADLAPFRPASFDVVFSAWAFGYVEDLNRVFRQVHRVLKVGAPLVFSLPHPAYRMLGAETASPTIERSYFDRSPIEYVIDGVGFTDFHHTVADIFTGLHRAGFDTDTILEPEPLPNTPRSSGWQPAMELVPRTIIWRARKLGS
ncbi:MAG TPA: class I SAM-dependent methyltransferase [Acidimicrobiales bacterium]|jgi:SAM-dependent methyltransferase